MVEGEYRQETGPEPGRHGRGHSPASDDGPPEHGWLGSHHLLFRAGEHEIEVRLRSDDLRRSAALTGAVRNRDGTPLAPGRVQVWLTSPGAEVAALPATRRGMFTARQIAPGRQTLEVVIDCERCHRLHFWA